MMEKLSSQCWQRLRGHVNSKKVDAFSPNTVALSAGKVNFTENRVVGCTRCRWPAASAVNFTSGNSARSELLTSREGDNSCVGSGLTSHRPAVRYLISVILIQTKPQVRFAERHGKLAAG